MSLLGDQLAEASRSWLKTPYLWAGESKKGADCSGLIRGVSTPLGAWPFDDPNTPKSQDRDGTANDLKTICVSIPWDERAPGDLVFYGTGKLERVTHVVMVLDRDTIIGANGGRSFLPGETLAAYATAMGLRDACVKTAPAASYRATQRMGVGRLPAVANQK